MPSLEVAQELLGFETQKALSLPMAAVIFGTVQVETVMEIVDRVCDPFFGTVKTAKSMQPGF